MLHVLLLGAQRATAVHAASLLRRFDVVSGALRGDEALALIALRPVHVIATPCQLEDMSAQEFANSVRRWHPRRRPQLVLMRTSDSEDVAEPLDAFDAMVTVGRSSMDLSDAVSTVASAAIRPSHFADELSGTFHGVDFAALVQVIAQKEKTGRLVVDDGRNESCLLYRHGQVIHAASRGLNGQEAFRFLLKDVADRPDASFYFEAFRQCALEGVQPTISCQVENLILEAA